MRVKILTTFLLSLCCLPLAWSMPSGDDSEIIRKAIDDTCGDSWCEGDYAYVFQKVNLHPEDNSTEVLFNMSLESPLEIKTADQQPSQQKIVRLSFDVACTVEGFSDITSIMSNEFSLNWDFYLRLSGCVQALERRIRNISVSQ